MTEVSVTSGADVFRPHHAERHVTFVEDVIAVDRLPEARPAGAGLEFGGGGKERKITPGANEYSGAFFFEQGTGEGAFGAGFTQDAVLGRRQFLAPFAFT